MAIALGVQPLYACAKAVRDLPSEDLPLGSIKYNFRDGIKRAFAPLNNLIKDAYNYVLVVVEVHDFLDGRVVTTYGYLTFFGEQIYTVLQGYHFEDTVRTNPQLLTYCFTQKNPSLTQVETN